MGLRGRPLGFTCRVSSGCGRDGSAHLFVLILLPAAHRPSVTLEGGRRLRARGRCDQHHVPPGRSFRDCHAPRPPPHPVGFLLPEGLRAAGGDLAYSPSSPA